MSWIKCSDELPEESRKVLAAEYWDNGYCRGIMTLTYMDGGFHDETMLVHADGGDTYLNIEPTHWQPLPSPPL